MLHETGFHTALPISSHTYNLGFTAFGLGASHALALASVFAEFGEWDLAREHAIERNVFRQTKTTSNRRLEREFRLRLQTLTVNQLALLVSHPAEARIPIALLAAFKRYDLIRDFSAEVLAEKVSQLDFELRPSDYSSFIEHLEPAHPELLKLTDTTLKKIRQVTFRVLTEGGILSPGLPHRIAPAILPESVIEVIRRDDPALLKAFLQPVL
jgi:hypothetical protein